MQREDASGPQVINADMNLLRQHLGLAEPEDRFVTVLKVQKGAGSWKAKIKNDAVRACPGWSSALSVSHRKSVSYGAFVWARTALNSRDQRFPAI